MKWIQYKIYQSTVNDEDILLDKKVGYSDANLAIAKTEAYNGEYTIKEDSQEAPEIVEPNELTEHIDDEDIHVTKKNKEMWNGKLSTKGLDANKIIMTDAQGNVTQVDKQTFINEIIAALPVYSGETEDVT